MSRCWKTSIISIVSLRRLRSSIDHLYIYSLKPLLSYFDWVNKSNIQEWKLHLNTTTLTPYPTYPLHHNQSFNCYETFHFILGVFFEFGILLITSLDHVIDYGCLKHKRKNILILLSRYDRHKMNMSEFNLFSVYSLGQIWWKKERQNCV